MPDATAPSEPAETSPPEAKISAWRSFKRLNHLQLLAATLGAAGLVLGAVLAWRSESATTLLIVSTVLLVLAALGLDWSEIRGAWGGASVELSRTKQIEQIEERVEEAAERAADKTDPDELRAEFEALRSEVKELAQAPPARRLRPPPQTTISSTSVDLQATLRELLKTKATHSFRGRHAAVLSLRIGAYEPATSAPSRRQAAPTTPLKPSAERLSALGTRPTPPPIQTTSRARSRLCPVPTWSSGAATTSCKLGVHSRSCSGS